tara:strand:- start:20865 stop:21065 length:201 start_codon:yes stop_codon:yes gene_type:complete
LFGYLKKNKTRFKIMEYSLGKKTVSDLYEFCEKENIKIIERLIKENRELRLRIEDIEYDIELINKR